MATGLVKWWRARFLAGYKPFSVVGGNNEASDSEELLGGVGTPCTASPPPPSSSNVAASFRVGSEPLLPTSSPETDEGLLTQRADERSSGSPIPPNINEQQQQQGQPTAGGTTRQLSFEEFECDVSVAEGDRRRQEFSFTLYDFDGHGKITKDDIAGLVTTIYDTLGASIQVPPCGSKTIKVKLTVSPDQRTGRLNSSRVPTTSFTVNSPCCHHLRHAATSCIHQNSPTAHNPVGTRHTSSHRRVPRRRRLPRHRCQAEPKEPETHSEDDADNTRTTLRVKQEELRRRVGPVPHLPSPYSNSSEGDVSEDSDVTIRSFTPLTPLISPGNNQQQRKRSGALQRQQLLEIIQANMEKNNLSFHTSRKRHQEQQPKVPPEKQLAENTRVDVNCHHYRQNQNSSQLKRGHHVVLGRETTQILSGSCAKSQPGGKSRNLPRKSRIQQATTVQQQQPQQQPQQQKNESLTEKRKRVPLHRDIADVGNQGAVHLTNYQSPRQQNNLQNYINPSQPVHQNHQAPPNYQTTIQQDHQSQPAVGQQQPCGKLGANCPAGGSSKKHQLKHATREQDQARAMAQVVRWLEREFSQTAAGNNRRHVHEHIHHHYHHYHAEALV